MRSKIKHLRPLILLFIFFLLTVIACRKDPYQVNVSHIDLNLTIHRLEYDMFTLTLDSIEESIPGLANKYGAFFDLFNYRIINIGGADQPVYPEYLLYFLTDQLNNEVYARVMQVFPDISWLETELTEAFRHYRYYFPQKDIPELVTYVSRFNQSVVTAEGYIGIGLDKYLGPETEYYEQLGLHSYMIMNMHPSKISSDCIVAWLLSEYEMNDSAYNLLAEMIYQGQIMYGVKSMLPNQPDSLIMGFTAGQMAFCRLNEEQMWEYLVEHKLLFETERFEISKFTGYGPFTSEFTNSSPARAAVWMGWRIVEQYARRNPGMSLAVLMEQDDYQRILTESKYSP
ncbi:MAG: hypothetical protein ISS19_07760 [Bacteroidales bacterium]|nr:hypothetical protein [Bacteroidales bacterium]